MKANEMNWPFLVYGQQCWMSLGQPMDDQEWDDFKAVWAGCSFQ